MVINYDLFIVKSAMDGFKSSKLTAEDVVKKLEPIYRKMIIEEVAQGVKVLKVLTESEVVSQDYIDEKHQELKDRMKKIESINVHHQ